MSVRSLSRVKLMFMVRGVTIKWYQSLGYDSVDIQGRIERDLKIFVFQKWRQNKCERERERDYRVYE